MRNTLESDAEGATPIWAPLVERYADAYRQMAAVGYRPAAPSDGMGNITVPLSTLNLAKEAEAYAKRFVAEENTRKFWVGCSEYSVDKAFVWTIEAARLLCAKVPGSAELAHTLLTMAAQECQRVNQDRAKRRKRATA